MEEPLSEAFWSVARQLRHGSKDMLAPYDITPSQWRVLRVLTRHGQMRLSDLAGHLRIAPRSTTEVVDALEERGLIERSPDPGDRRATLVALTGEGVQVAAALQSARDEGAEQLFARLSATDRAHLSRILGRLRE